MERFCFWGTWHGFGARGPEFPLFTILCRFWDCRYRHYPASLTCGKGGFALSEFWGSLHPEGEGLWNLWTTRDTPPATRAS